MSRPSSARDRRTNGSACDAARRRRGALLVWLDREMEWPGRPRTFSEAALPFGLGREVPFGLAAAEGAAQRPRSEPAANGRGRSLSKMAGLADGPVPDPSPPVPQAEDRHPPDPLSARRRSPPPAGRRHGRDEARG